MVGQSDLENWIKLEIGSESNPKTLVRNILDITLLRKKASHFADWLADLR